MLLSPGTCWFPTPPAILNPRPKTTEEHILSGYVWAKSMTHFICLEILVKKNFFFLHLQSKYVYFIKNISTITFSHFGSLNMLA